MNIKEEEEKESVLSVAIFWFVTFCFLLILFLLLVISPIYSIWDYKRHQELHRVGIPATAIVSDKYKNSGKGGYNYYLYYKYSIQTDSLQMPEIEVKKQVYSDLYDFYNPEDRIEIIYSPSEIEFSDIAASDHYYFYRRMFIVMLIIDAMFFFLYLGARKSERIAKERENEKENGS